ncbi:16417_t:CDS:2, partial [Acaulospora morrowiae]
DNEFVIGNSKGKLDVFKGIPKDRKPIITEVGLGTITCVAVGDIKNSGKNSIVCVNAEGGCYVFDVTQTSALDTIAKISVPINCNRIIIADVDGDGRNEIILARSDRILNVYDFVITSTDGSDSCPLFQEKAHWEFDGQVTSLSTATDPTTSAPLLLVGQPG